MNYDSNQYEVITIALADDHELFRDGLQSVISKVPGVSVMAAVENGLELVKVVEEHHPRIVITDLQMPVLDGIETTKIIKERFPATKVIALTSLCEYGVISDLVVAGADGYLLKTVSLAEIKEAINTVLSGNSYFCKEAQQVLEHNLDKLIPKAPPPPSFTEREIEVMKLIAKGLSSKQIAAELYISLRTVETHRHSLQKKTGTNNIAGIALYAERNGFLAG